MPLETSDLNDNTILERTRQLTDGKGAMQFKIDLDDGPITSEWFPAEKKSTELLLKWVEAVKSQAVARSEARMEEQRAQIRRQKAEAAEEAQKAAAMGIISAAPAGLEPAHADLRPGPIQYVPPPQQFLSPKEMAKQEIDRAQAELQQLLPLLQAAQQRVAQWTAVLQTMQSIELSQQTGVIQPVKSVSDGLKLE